MSTHNTDRPVPAPQFIIKSLPGARLPFLVDLNADAPYYVGLTKVYVANPAQARRYWSADQAERDAVAGEIVVYLQTELGPDPDPAPMADLPSARIEICGDHRSGHVIDSAQVSGVCVNLIYQVRGHRTHGFPPFAEGEPADTSSHGYRHAQYLTSGANILALVIGLFLALAALVAPSLRAQITPTRPGSGYTDRIRPFSEGQDIDHTPCRQNETGPQCQARLGADWEVIQSTDGKLAGERIARVVNVNTASAAQLMLLPGVGNVLAGRIIAARPFATVTSLHRVKGIGHGIRLARLTRYVTVSGATTLTHKVGSVR